MIDKKFKGGRTYKGAIVTVNYLLNERVDEGTAKVLDGNRDITLRLIKEASKKFKWSWSSGVLSFEETISEKMAKEIIVEHKRVTYCGLDADRFNSLYILHLDKGRSEIHYISPRMELSTGKSFNPYFVKRDLKKKICFKTISILNMDYQVQSKLKRENSPLAIRKIGQKIKRVYRSK